MKQKNINHNNQGFGLLIAVILVAAAIVGIIITSGLLSRSNILEGDRLYQVNQVYYAVEGAMYETLQHIKADPDWPSETNYSNTYLIGSVQISRIITSSGDGSKEVDITAEKGDAKRRLLASVSTTEGSSLPLDVVLTLDVSGSMDDDGYDNDLDEFQPIGNVKVAAAGNNDHEGFIDRLSHSRGDRVALVKYSTEGVTVMTLTGGHSAVENAIWDLSCTDFTNIGDGIVQAVSILDQGSHPPSVPAIVLLSDGNANRPAPVDFARNYALSQADIADSQRYRIFTISLGESADTDLMEEIADRTNGYHFYVEDRTDLDELDEIFNQLTEILESVLVYELREALPEP
ncbi:VWA domain-containing protein [Patescibacteria group bacterium]|nr:VWA domain-containing protein [Patescibacteria group bacterium]